MSDAARAKAKEFLGPNWVDPQPFSVQALANAFDAYAAEQTAGLRARLAHAADLIRDLHTGGNQAYVHSVKDCECCALLADPEGQRA